MDGRNHEIKENLCKSQKYKIQRKELFCEPSERISESRNEFRCNTSQRLPDLKNYQHRIDQETNEIEANREIQSDFHEIFSKRQLKLPICNKRLIHHKNRRKNQLILGDDKHFKLISDHITENESQTQLLPPLEDLSNQLFCLTTVGTKHPLGQQTIQTTRGIAIKTIQHLISQYKKSSSHQSKRKPSTELKPMYSNTLPNKLTLTQKQFTKELEARLTKLASERREAENVQSDTDCKSSANSLTKNTTKTKLSKRDNIHLRKNISTNDQQPYYIKEVDVKQLEYNAQSLFPDNKDKHSDVEEEILQTNQQDSPPHSTAQNTCMWLKEENDENLDYMSTILTHSSNGQTRPNSSTNRKNDTCRCTDTEILDEPLEAGDIMPTVYTDELDCLDDDTPAMEDTESAQDISDSEVSCSEHQPEVAGALYPVIASLFPNTPSVIRFVGENQRVTRLPKPFRSRLRWRPSAITPNVVKRILKRSHFRLTLKNPDWLGYYGNHLKPMAFRPIREFQKVNHFPGSFQLGRKDKLWSNLSRLRSQFGRKMVDFVPRTFSLPSEARLLKEVWARYDDSICEYPNNMIGNCTRPRWIMKPPASARGIGIKVLRQWSDVPRQRNVIIQSYISRPYLINETKFDLRLYVYVTGFNPLRAYLHREGLVRFASQKYSNALSDTGNRFIHLTNYSVNKHNKEEQTGVENHKWKLETLWAYLNERCINVDALWAQIKDIIFKTLASVSNHISLLVDQNCRRRTCAHELFGFDVLLDADLKPWLLEVNVSPSLHTNTALDNEVKTTLVTDMLNIAGFRLPPEYRSGKHSRSAYDETSVTSTTTTTTTANEVRCEATTNVTSNKDAHFEDSTTTPSVSENRTYTLSNSAYTNCMQNEGLGTIQNSSNSNSSIRHLHNTTTSVRPTSNQAIGRPNVLTAHSMPVTSLFIPVSDPRLWDLQLTWDERQKHMYHSRLLCKEESPLRAALSSLRLTSGQSKINRADRSGQTNPFARRSSAQPSSKHPELTVLDELRDVVSHLTPDDVRTLIDFVDERYRASMGNFECIFPVSGDHGLQLLLFLEACAASTNSGNLGLRSPDFRYYDLVQYAFLTVYHRKDVSQKSVLRKSQLDSAAITQFPDYHILKHGELSGDALIMASKMTEISREGLIRLIELCKRGFHLCGTEASNQRVRWNQSNKCCPVKDRALFYKPEAPIELGIGRVKNNTQKAKGDGHSEDSGDTVDCILGGAVSFRAQPSTTKPQQLVKQSSLDSLYRDSGFGASVVSSSSTTSGCKSLKTSVKPQSITVHRTFVCPQPIQIHKSTRSAGQIRSRSVLVDRSSVYSGRAIGETMGWWNRCRSAVATNRFPGPPSQLTIPKFATVSRLKDLSAARQAILEGTYLARSDEHVDLSNMLDAQSIRELTKTVRQKRKSLEQSQTVHNNFQLDIPSSSLVTGHKRKSKRCVFSHLKPLDPSKRVEKFLNAQSVQKLDTRLWRYSNRERSATPSITRFKTTDSPQHQRSISNYYSPISSKNLVRTECSNAESNEDIMTRHTTKPKPNMFDADVVSPRGVPAWI